jgi:hypothetical protein
MASTVVRNPNKTGLVLISSNVSVAEDGFINVTARWLAPVAGLSATDFILDSEWPRNAAPLPTGMPNNQGGPYLVGRTIVKQNGLTFVDTNYATAVAPVRIISNSSSSRASFSGYAEDDEGNSGSISFDYHTVTRTYSYATVTNVPMPQPPAAPGGIYNFRQEGKYDLVRYIAAKTVTAQKETIGRVSRFQVTASSIYEQDNPEFFSNYLHDASGEVFNENNLVYSVG